MSKSTVICVDRMTQIESVDVSFATREPVCRNSMISLRCPDNISDIQMIDYQTFIGISTEDINPIENYPTIDSHIVIFNRDGEILDRVFIDESIIVSSTSLSVSEFKVNDDYIASVWNFNNNSVGKHTIYGVGNIHKIIRNNETGSYNGFEVFSALEIDSNDGNSNEKPYISYPYIHTDGSVSVLIGVPRTTIDDGDNIVYFKRWNSIGILEFQRLMILDLVALDYEDSFEHNPLCCVSMYGERLWCGYDRYAVGLGTTQYLLPHIDGHGAYDQSLSGIQVVDANNGHFIICAPNIDIYTHYDDDRIVLGRYGFVDEYLGKYTVAVLNSTENFSTGINGEVNDELEVGIVIYDTSHIKTENIDGKKIYYDQKFAIAHIKPPTIYDSDPNRMAFGKQLLMLGNLIFVTGTANNGYIHIYNVLSKDDKPSSISFICTITPEYINEQDISIFADTISIKDNVVTINSVKTDNTQIVTLIDLECFFIKHSIYAGLKEIELIKNGVE